MARYRIRVTETYASTLTIEAEDISDHCKDCKFAQAWQCGAKVFHYCEKRKTKHAVNGLRKVRLKDTACPLFEKKENPTKAK